VQCDRANGHAREGVASMENWITTRRLQVVPGDLVLVEELGETNMGDPDTLVQFIDWSVSNYPADRYFMVFWNHGASWPGFGGDESTETIDLLTLPELKKGLLDGLTRNGLDRFDIIGFDACLMANYETAVALKELGWYLLASEELEPGHGWNYTRLQAAKSNPGIMPIDLAKGIMEGFNAQAVVQGEEMGITLSLVSLYELDSLLSAIDDLAGAMNADTMRASNAVMEARSNVQEFGKAPDPAQSTHMVDLGQLAFLLRLDADFSSQAEALLTALGKAVVHAIKGSGVERADGLAIYLPSRQEYYEAEYDSVPGIDAWRSAVKNVLSELKTDATGPLFLNADHLADFWYEGDTVVVSGKLDQNTTSDLGQTYLLYGVADADSQVEYFLGSSQAGVNALSVVTGYWDVSALTLSQGSLVSYGFLSLEMDAGGYVLASIPLLYESPFSDEPGYVIWMIAIDPDTGDVELNTYYLVTDAGLGELYPETGTYLYPLLVQVDAEGQQWVVSSEEGYDAAKDIALEMAPLGVGTTVSLYLFAEDYAGNADYVWAGGEL